MLLYTYYFRSVLPLYRNHTIDLESKSIGWFLYNGNTANVKYYLFHMLFLTLMKTFFAPFPKCPAEPNLFRKNISKSYLIITIKWFMITRILKISKINKITLSYVWIILFLRPLSGIF